MSKHAVAKLVAAVLAFTATCLLPNQPMAGQRSIRTGNSYEFQFQGNPSTGYKWYLNTSKSSGLDAVRIDDLGYGNPVSRKMGAPAPYLFRLTCVKAGNAELVFDYISPDKQTVAKSHTHWARCD